MRQRSTPLRTLLAGVLLFLGVGQAAAQEGAPAVQFMAGAFNVGKKPTQAEVGVELRRPIRWWGLDFAAGVAASEESSIWVHVGLRRDFEAGPRFVIAPGFAFAYYDRGDGKDLGGDLQFRTSLDLGYRLSHKSRVGLTFYHLSNAGLETVNPGANSVMFSYGVRLKGR